MKYNKKRKKLQQRHLSTDCHSLLRKAGQLVVDSDDDPDYGLAVDYGVKPGAFGNSH
jgi:SulP family sulfate permease